MFRIFWSFSYDVTEIERQADYQSDLTEKQITERQLKSDIQSS